MEGRIWKIVLLAAFVGVCAATQDMEKESGVVPGETGKIYFSGTGYTINLIPHVILIGLAVLAFVFLYGGDLTGGAEASSYGAPEESYGAPDTGYGAPATGYGAPEVSYGAPAPSYGAPATVYSALSRYYDPYEGQAAPSGLASWDPVNGQVGAKVAGEGKRRKRRSMRKKRNI